MGVLDKDYQITVDIRNGEITSDEVIFASQDQNVSNMNILFVRDGSPVDITGFVFVANIQKPDTFKIPFEISIVDAKNGLGRVDLPMSLTFETGTYNVEIEMAKDDEISHSYTFSYDVRETLCAAYDGSFEDDANILIKLVQDVRQLEINVNNNENIRVRKENERTSQETVRQAQESQRQKNDVDRETKVNTKLTVMDDKVVEVETRFNRLTASQQQSSEVIDARNSQDGIVYNSLRERLNALENNPYVLFETVEG